MYRNRVSRRGRAWLRSSALSASVQLAGSPAVPPGPVPSINKSTAKNGTLVVIKARYGRRCSALPRASDDRGGGHKRCERWTPCRASCQFNSTSEKESRRTKRKLKRTRKFSFVAAEPSTLGSSTGNFRLFQGGGEKCFEAGLSFEIRQSSEVRRSVDVRLSLHRDSRRPDRLWEEKGVEGLEVEET